ncbi:MAG: ScpA family protein [Candidatus Dormibacteria bacterium]
MSGDEAFGPERLTAVRPPVSGSGAGSRLETAEAPAGPAGEPPALEVTGRLETGPDPLLRVGGATGADEAGRFQVDVPGYRGPLAGLVARAQRGDLDLTTVPVSGLTGAYRRAVAQADPPVEPREIADFIGLAARLLTLKAQRVIPDGPLDGVVEEPEEADEAGDQPGRRLAEYRLFRAAAEALLGEAAEEGTRSFLGLVAPEVIPVERLAIPAERLAAAFRAVLLRIDAREEVLAGAPTFSVADKLNFIRALLQERGQVGFEELFAGVSGRMEAVAVFLALLELMRQGGARVEQQQPFGAISVSRLG